VLGDDVEGTTLVVPTPSGVPYTQGVAAELATRRRLVFACGRYEGIDARVMTHYRDRVDLQEISLGDYVLNGGEVAALAIIESVVRLLPGVIGNPESLVEESHSPDLDGLLEYPVFTKPLEWRGLTIPDVLVSGHHARISAWRRERAEQLTSDRHPPVA
jgi:tRNA (guanine37-N1)-methyltransferase